MIIMGIDHGNTVTGYGLVELNIETNDLSVLEYGYIKDRHEEYPRSLVYIPDKLNSLIRHWKPDVTVLEGPKDNKGFKSYQKQVELLGCIKGLLVRRGRPFVEIPPSTMKRIVSGNGWASKEEVARSISERFNIPFEELVLVKYYKVGKRLGQMRSHTLDGSDALGLALAFPVYYKEKKHLDYREEA